MIQSIISQTDKIPSIQLSKSISVTLMKEKFSEDLDPKKFPTQSKEIANNSHISSVCAQIREYLIESLGFCVIKLNLNPSTDNSSIISGLWNFFTCFAQPIAQYKTGELSFKVYDKGNASTQNHYSNSNQGGAFHTDGTFLSTPPLYVALLCVHQAELGGESILIDSRKLYEEIKHNYPKALVWLQKQYQFDCCNQQQDKVTQSKAIFDPYSPSPFIQYLRGYIVSGHKKIGQPIDPEAIKSMDLLDELSAKEKFQYIFKLERGEMLIFNNHIMLHGRKRFTDQKNKRKQRLLLRLYGQKY